MPPVAFTLIESTNPPRLCKVLSLVDGALHSTSAASVSDGVAHRIEVPGARELAATIDATKASAVFRSVWNLSDYWHE